MRGFLLLVGSSTRSASLKMFSKSHRFKYAASRRLPLLFRILLARKYCLFLSSRATYTVRSTLLFESCSFIQYWMKEHDSNNKVLLTVYVARDDKNRQYFLASNILNKSGKRLLAAYLNRWDLENIFKDADRVELPTSSRNPRMRLYCTVLSFFLFTLWQLQSILDRTVWSLRGFVKKLITALCKLLSCIVSAVGEIQHHPP